MYHVDRMKISPLRKFHGKRSIRNKVRRHHKWVKFRLRSKLRQNTLVSIVFVFAKKYEKKPVLGFATALTPECIRKTFDGDSKSVIGFSARLFQGEIRQKNSEKQRNAHYVTFGNLSIIKLLQFTHPASPHQWSKLQTNRLKGKKVMRV